ncbi:nucleotide sugar dehydrogenase [Azospirillum brasilense]|uniref:nucleotide sugar dehydrogenase n=1 Tax=Azospirillum brasilense TaxID=192 RepID=UPI001909FAE6|nr:nucleotide sugar dehydrogenase [Azospirillum brasilense]MBK3735322.1 nucleotide sugar dehydrogenase [Azospirillum brasilense]
MRIGVIGLGKLGLPCAVAMALKGHDVMGFDVRPDVMNKGRRSYTETGPDGCEPFDPYLEASSLRFGTLEEVVDHADLLFIAVQTPHDPLYEGITRLPDSRTDFHYEHLVAACRDVARVASRDTVVVIISTVLPGTIRRHVLPVLTPRIKLCYNPFFIAMGTTMRDFLQPEFVLFGRHDREAAALAEAFYRTITDAPFYATALENAELIKVAYNTFIGMKIAFANTMMEVCHKLPGTDVDAVTDCLALASRRLISPSYMKGGMGDGGGCHPRDNIAMSWLARELDLSFDTFDAVMRSREKQTEWLADLMCAHEPPKVILGWAFKSDCDMATGSPALLLRAILEERGVPVTLIDPHMDSAPLVEDSLPVATYLIGAKHSAFAGLRFPAGSVVLDPWRYIPTDQDGVRVIPVGVGPGIP